MTPFEKALRDALALIDARVPGTCDLPCPGEETWVVFAQGGLSADRRRSLREHLSACPRCRDILALGVRAETPGLAIESVTERSPALRRQVLDLLGPGPAFDLVLNRIRDGVRILHAGVKLLAQPENRLAPALLRSEAGGYPAGTAVRAEKQLGGYLAEVGVIPAVRERWDVRVFLSKSGRAPERKGLRISLKDLHRGMELHSIMAARGAAVFQGLRSGDYGLEFRRTGTAIGSLRLRLTSDEDGT